MRDKIALTTFDHWRMLDLCTLEILSIISLFSFPVHFYVEKSVLFPVIFFHHSEFILTKNDEKFSNDSALGHTLSLPRGILPWLHVFENSVSLTTLVPLITGSAGSSECPDLWQTAVLLENCSKSRHGVWHSLRFSRSLALSSREIMCDNESRAWYRRKAPGLSGPAETAN